MNLSANTPTQLQKANNDNNFLQARDDWETLANLPPHADFLTASTAALMMLCRVLSRKASLLASQEATLIHPRLERISQASAAQIDYQKPFQIPRISAADASPEKSCRC
ncbi:MAG: hypothetical protein HC800_09300 [Phormidesmis sp. RL_2_1]|nr:hypothetical protein [Phormidesmis sp. RL_2_1]